MSEIYPVLQAKFQQSINFHSLDVVDPGSEKVGSN